MSRGLVALLVPWMSACAARATPVVDGASATVTLRSALTRAPEAPEVVVSCTGGGYCRENRFSAAEETEADEAREDCERRRGALGAAPCPSEHAIVTCTGDRMRVVAYEQADPAEEDEAVASILETCEPLGGVLASRAR